ncbi:helix-turn-helix transcriptional regulator [Sneathia vaginalis]|uniref:helix-turn-helix transcriptional regulator n=1 Tax=Sneathia vaginalis TaxID=187101 RepID=UPI00370DE11F
MKNTISQLRKQHKITQEELANEVGVTRQTITSIETGKYIASLPLAFKIAKFFDMSIEEIFSVEEDD